MFKSMNGSLNGRGNIRDTSILALFFPFSAACLRRSLQWLPLMPLIKQSQLIGQATQ